MSQLADEALVMQAGYLAGYYGANDIEVWADKHIASIDSPSESLLDLSFLKHTYPRDIHNLLEELGKQSGLNKSHVSLGFIGVLYKQREIDAGAVVRKLSQLLLLGFFDSDAAVVSRVYWLDDEYFRAFDEGYGSLREVEQEVADFLRSYVAKLEERWLDLSN